MPLNENIPNISQSPEEIFDNLFDFQRSPILQAVAYIYDKFPSEVKKFKDKINLVETESNQLAKRLEGSPVQVKIQNLMQKRLGAIDVLENTIEIDKDTLYKVLSLIENSEDARHIKNKLSESLESVESLFEKNSTKKEKLAFVFPDLDLSDKDLDEIEVYNNQYSFGLLVHDRKVFIRLFAGKESTLLNFISEIGAIGYSKQVNNIPVTMVDTSHDMDTDKVVGVMQHEHYHALRTLCEKGDKVYIQLGNAINEIMESDKSGDGLKKVIQPLIEKFYNDYLMEELLAHVIEDFEIENLSIEIFDSYSSSFLKFLKGGAIINGKTITKLRNKQKKEVNSLSKIEYNKGKVVFGQALEALKELSKKGFSNYEIVAIFTPVFGKGIPAKRWLTVAKLLETKSGHDSLS